MTNGQICQTNLRKRDYPIANFSSQVSRFSDQLHRQQLRDPFHKNVDAAIENQRVVVDIALNINKASSVLKVPVNIKIERLPYNEMGNLCRHVRIAATSGMLLPVHRELLLLSVRI